MNNKPMLNAYPDSLGGKLEEIVNLLKTDEMQDVFSSFYVLPSLYHSDLDRGFSVVDYELNEELADREDLERLKELGIDLKLDFILNHASAQSPQFRDLVEKGEASDYRDFFIDWNQFSEADVLPQTGVADSDGGISGWEEGSVLEHVLSGSTWQAVSRTDGFKHQVAEGVGFLSEYAGEDCFLRSVHCAAGCVCLCAEGTRQEKFLK